jgi:tRNA (cytidine/uridine-2'-O-)-methyltransferase
MRIALYQPDIAQNTGTILRLCACLGFAADIIEPTGFPWSEPAFRRAGMDYLDAVSLTRHASWEAFLASRVLRPGRIVLMTTRAAEPYLTHEFRDDDILLFGRESAGVPDEVHAVADNRLLIPMQNGMRSLNIAMAAAMVAGEAVRQRGAT